MLLSEEAKKLDKELDQAIEEAKLKQTTEADINEEKGSSWNPYPVKKKYYLTKSQKKRRGR